MKEAQVSKKLKDEFNKHGVFFKTTGIMGSAGTPDIVGCHYMSGKFIGVEVKIHPNKLTALQKHFLLLLPKGAGYQVTWHPKHRAYYVITNADAEVFKTVTEVVDWIIRQTCLNV